MLRFLDRAGWALSASLVLDCALRASPLLARPEPADAPDPPADPNDWSAPAANDFERLARDRVEVSLLRATDLDAIAQVDRHVSGRDRRAYLGHALDEALRDSGVRISLAARVDGVLAGFVMARADLGDFGRTEPVAVIDTVGVSPEYSQRGVGRALLEQLFLNLDALRIERVETAVAANAFALLAFFVRAGLAPAERLAFVKRLAA